MSRFLRMFSKRNRVPKPGHQSIDDYADDHALRSVMKTHAKDELSGSMHSVSGCSGSERNDSVSEDGSVSSFGSSQGASATPVEWTLPLVDTEVTEPQTMEEEVKRLKALQSYFVLDSEGEEEFDRITQMASEIFDVPIALVSLVDLGRQWFLSRVGLDATETPRKHAFCAHVILNKYKLLVVPDASKDFRFKDNPLVTGGIKIRFYAGAALVSPEGYKLGTLCIISPVTRPEGLSASQQRILAKMAGTVVSALVARRNRILKDVYERRFHELAHTFQETNQVLDTARASLEGVLSRQSWQMDTEDQVELSATVRSLGVQSKICAAAMRNVIQDTPPPPKLTNPGDDGPPISEVSVDPKKNGRAPKHWFEEEAIVDYDKVVNPTTEMQKVFENINTMVKNFPILGVVTVEVDKSVPKVLLLDDLLLFRCILNLLNHCMGGAQEGLGPENPLNESGVRIRKMKKDGNELLVECLQAGPPIESEKARELFANKKTFLAPVASMVRSMGGRYGMFQGRWKHQESARSDSMSHSSTGKSPMQSIFWFQVPYTLNDDENPTNPNNINGLRRKSRTRRNAFISNLIQIHSPSDPDRTSTSTEPHQVEGPRANGKYVPIDPFQAALMEMGCGTRGRMQ